MKPGKTGLTRIIHATGYSWAGLKAGYRHEAAIRQETWALAASLPLAFWLGEDALDYALLIGSVLFLMLVELLNSAIEAIVDLASPEKHELAGRAKDMGSAAVLFAVLLTLTTWALVLWG
ncbi:MAG: diacylglycerol kinase [Gammaproteobacteria bacterium]|nr:diacylglycerol kinase [Gammaproteobacteria bacterium]